MSFSLGILALFASYAIVSAWPSGEAPGDSAIALATSAPAVAALGQAN